jgi:hypothetical protein
MRMLEIRNKQRAHPATKTERARVRYQPNQICTNQVKIMSVVSTPVANMAQCLALAEYRTLCDDTIAHRPGLMGCLGAFRTWRAFEMCEGLCRPIH